ncbi:MAG: hypothetical protein ACO1SV_07315 [Fimbriimonas sp.]
MRRALPGNLVMKLLAAFLVLLGTSGQGFAAMLCGTPLCPKTIAAKPVPVAKKACCDKEKPHHGAPKQKDEKGEKKCCCEVKSGTPTAKLDAKLVVPSGLHLDVALPEPPAVIATAAVVHTANEIPSFTDASPPDPGVLPDRGRAPPTA